MLQPMLQRSPDRTHDEIRATQRDLWDRFAGGWETWHDVVDSVLGPVGVAMIDALEIDVDQRHLDVACGTGEPGLTIASIAAHGTVTLTDISPRMLDAATRRRRERGRSPTSTCASAAPTTCPSRMTASTVSRAASG